ncbi:hypothetical protein EST38_g13735 [Candolleomyces aberdarensis]|uniref:Uncharacterized protein n=1 Tax=Candolleomyces aberdarensis TaxID=2316362 RepID=A0A4Q2D013_9AGAR|nr:hypothetical protein EST38_g13735 [Candolleomyces aberdarensis]
MATPVGRSGLTKARAGLTFRHVVIIPLHPQPRTQIRDIRFTAQPPRDRAGTVPIPHHPLVGLASLRRDLKALNPLSDIALHNHTLTPPPLFKLTSKATLSVAIVLPVGISRNIRGPQAAFWPACHFLFGGL